MCECVPYAAEVGRGLWVSLELKLQTGAILWVLESNPNLCKNKCSQPWCHFSSTLACCLLVVSDGLVCCLSFAMSFLSPLQFDLGIFFEVGVKSEFFLRENLKASASYLGYHPDLWGLTAPLRVQTKESRQLQSTAICKTWFVIFKSQGESLPKKEGGDGHGFL